MAVEQHPGQRGGGLGRRSPAPAPPQLAGARSDHRPCALRRPEHGRASPRRGRPAAPPRRRRAASRQGERPHAANESLVTSPAHTRSQSASRAVASSSPVSSRKKHAPRSRQHLTQPLVLGRVGPLRGHTGTRHGASNGGLVAQEEHDLAVVAAERARAHPQHLARREQLVEQSGRVVGHARAGSTSRSSTARRGWRRPAAGPRPRGGGRRRARTATRRPARPGGSAPAPRPGWARPRAAAASDRWRSDRSTSGSHHSPVPPRPDGTRRATACPPRPAGASTSSTRPGGSPNRPAGSRRGNGPWVRAHRRQRPEPAVEDRRVVDRLEERVGQPGRDADPERRRGSGRHPPPRSGGPRRRCARPPPGGRAASASAKSGRVAASAPAARPA